MYKFLSVVRSRNHTNVPYLFFRSSMFLVSLFSIYFFLYLLSLSSFFLTSFPRFCLYSLRTFLPPVPFLSLYHFFTYMHRLAHSSLVNIANMTSVSELVMKQRESPSVCLFLNLHVNWTGCKSSVMSVASGELREMLRSPSSFLHFRGGTEKNQETLCSTSVGRVCIGTCLMRFTFREWGKATGVGGGGGASSCCC